MKAEVPARKRGVLIPALFTLVMFTVLIALGLWQLERLAWKENLIATLGQRLSGPPVPLRSLARSSLTQAKDEFRRISASAKFDPDTEARVYTSGGGLRDDIKSPGYFAFARAYIADVGLVMINRGFVANTNPDKSLRPIAVPEGAIDIVGALRWPEQPGRFVTPYSEQQDLWFVRDHGAMWNHYGWSADTRYDLIFPEPFYIELESPAPAGGVPRPGALTVKLRNDHFGYALTWFGLATVLLVTFGAWAARRERA